MRRKLILGLIVLSPLALSAEIPFKVKEGLWETTITSSGGGMSGMQDAMAKMTPEQRAQMEAMMKQKGMGMNGNTITAKSCVTKEKIEKGLAFAENKENCTHSVVNSSASHMELKIHCDETSKKDGSKTTMDSTTVIDGMGSDNVKGTTHIVSNSGGRTVNRDNTFTSKYLGSACGDIK